MNTNAIASIPGYSAPQIDEPREPHNKLLEQIRSQTMFATSNDETKKIAQKAGGTQKKETSSSSMQDKEAKEEISVNEKAAQRMAQLQKKLDELSAKLEQMGLRMEIDFDKQHGQLVRIFNDLSNKEVATIPLYLLLKDIDWEAVAAGGRTEPKLGAVTASANINLVA